MIFQWFTIFFGWASILTFILLVIYKIYQFGFMPLNLRWEVYPVPGNNADDRQNGSSYMQQVDWAKNPQTRSHSAKLREMIVEILTLKRLRANNTNQLWPISLTMHWGIYMLLLWLALLAAAIIVPALTTLLVGVGVGALILGTIGVVGLIIKRLMDNELSLYSAPIDYFNLAFLIAIFGLGIISWLADPLFSGHQAYIRSLLSFKPTEISPMVVAMFLTLQTFAVYMPFSKLIHYIMKHFTFTETLWDDGFNVVGSKKEKRILRQLSYEMNWSAPHIEKGATWLEGVQGSSVGEDEQ